MAGYLLKLASNGNDDGFALSIDQPALVDDNDFTLLNVDFVLLIDFDCITNKIVHSYGHKSTLPAPYLALLVVRRRLVEGVECMLLYTEWMIDVHRCGWNVTILYQFPSSYAWEIPKCARRRSKLGPFVLHQKLNSLALMKSSLSIVTQRPCQNE